MIAQLYAQAMALQHYVHWPPLNWAVIGLVVAVIRLYACDMNKKLIYIISFIAIIILGGLVYLLVLDKFVKNNSLKSSTLNQTQGEVPPVSSLTLQAEQQAELAAKQKADEAAQALAVAQKAAIQDAVTKVLDQVAASSKTPYIKETSTTFMTDAEKAVLHLAPSVKAQVFAKDDKGNIMSYKVINSDADILSSW